MNPSYSYQGQCVQETLAVFCKVWKQTTVSNLFATLQYSSDLIIAAQRYFDVKIYKLNPPPRPGQIGPMRSR